MTYQTVRSSNVHSIAHDSDGTMHVRFACKSCKGTGKQETPPHQRPAACETCHGDGYGSQYKYPKVPTVVFQQVADAKSVGTAFDAHVRKKFKGEKV